MIRCVGRALIRHPGPSRFTMESAENEKKTAGYGRDYREPSTENYNEEGGM